MLSGEEVRSVKEVVEAGRHVDIHYKLPLFTVAQVKSITSYQVQFQFSSLTGKREGKWTISALSPSWVLWVLLWALFRPISVLFTTASRNLALSSRVDHNKP